MYDKRKQFEDIDKALSEIRIMCNRAQIPFIFVAAVYDDDEKTEYKVAADENQEENTWEKYSCNTLTPGMFEMHLHDDKIKEIVKVMNGYKAVPADSKLAIAQEDMEVDASTFYNNGTKEKDEGGSVFYMAEPQKEEKHKRTSAASSDLSLFENIMFDQ